MSQQSIQNSTQDHNHSLLDAETIQQFQQQAHRERSLLIHCLIKKFKSKRR